MRGHARRPQAGHDHDHECRPGHLPLARQDASRVPGPPGTTTARSGLSRTRRHDPSLADRIIAASLWGWTVGSWSMSCPRRCARRSSRSPSSRPRAAAACRLHRPRTRRQSAPRRRSRHPPRRRRRHRLADRGRTGITERDGARRCHGHIDPLGGMPTHSTSPRHSGRSGSRSIDMTSSDDSTHRLCRRRRRSGRSPDRAGSRSRPMPSGSRTRMVSG